MSGPGQQEQAARGAISPAKQHSKPVTVPHILGGALSCEGHDGVAQGRLPQGDPPAAAGPVIPRPARARPSTVTAGRDRPVKDAAAADLGAAVEGARQGDSDAFRVLYRETQPRLMRYLAYLVGTDAEDVASETWLQATRDLGKFDGGHDEFRGWITTIARHRALDHLRHHSRQPSFPVPAEDLADLAAADDTAARAIESITTDAALQLIGGLPRDQAEAVLLRAVVGLDARTAAKMTGKRAGAIRTAAYRGLHALAKRLDSPASTCAAGD